ncbi:MAG: esterase-like activity of phytase family protein [Bacteriovoracaceae bacterium]|nr:esterase-like activity of phytase family protein [Bacteriovoracaceae bacterium]
MFKYVFLIFILSCAKLPSSPQTNNIVRIDAPAIGDFDLGAFSGLSFSHKSQNGELHFWSITDRGPNLESYSDAERGVVRPFLMPYYQPQILEIILNPKTHSARVAQRIPLKNSKGMPLSGLPNLPPLAGRVGDEFPVTKDGKSLSYDLEGIDSEGVCLIENKFWVADEYGPSLLQFNRQGRLLKRLVPKEYVRQGEPESHIKEVLPERLMTRKMNRGFEGIACAKNKIYAVMQSPLPGDGNSVIILEINPAHHKVTNQYLYPLNETGTDKIGDLTWHNGKLYLIEQNSSTGKSGNHFVFEVSMPKGRDLKIQKKLVSDLTKAGFDFSEKLEGLSFISHDEFAVVNDNDFGVANKGDKSYIGLFRY